MEAQTETTSRNSVLKRDALSEWRPERKPCPGIQPQSGTPFPVETTCLDIFLRPLLQGVDGLIHVEQVSHDADNKEHRQVAKAEDFAANKDGCEQCVGGAAKDGGVSQRGAEFDGHAEDSGEHDAKARSDGEQRRHLATLISCGKRGDGECEFERPVPRHDDNLAVVAQRCRYQVCAKATVSPLPQYEQNR